MNSKRALIIVPIPKAAMASVESCACDHERHHGGRRSGLFDGGPGNTGHHQQAHARRNRWRNNHPHAGLVSCVQADVACIRGLTSSETPASSGRRCSRGKQIAKWMWRLEFRPHRGGYHADAAWARLRCLRCFALSAYAPFRMKADHR